ncbi:peptidoglycan D,D-transpeptidase FtsI family protein [Tessaracoccus sp. OS52]|uniref:peptidoglycan D,D-transpeptidase FtsI family protein n=1 Tax=Tessaracoccus sp. OS52 TaxID=2886691 RepID=UPI00351D4A1C
MGRSSTRIRAFMVVMALLVTVCVGRALQLQAFDSQAMAAQAAEKMQSTRELAATRGSITDRNGVVLAATEPAMLISVDPDMVMTNGADKRYPMSERKQEEAAAAPQAVAAILAKHLGGREATYLDVLTTPDSRYEIIAKKVPAATWTAIQKDMKAGMDGEGRRPWHGLFATSDPIRTYPQHALAGNVVGFVNGEGVGAAGLEAVLNDELDGEPGQEIYDASTYGRIPLGENVMTPAVDGVDVETTLDSDLQWFTEQALADGMKNSGAKTGMAVVMDVHSGEILALANGPSYDPSDPGAVDSGDLGNPAVSAAYEPGSVQKVLTMAALADQGLVTPDTKVAVPGRIASGGGFVRDSFSHGDLQLTARGVIAQSSNIGTILLTRQLSKDTLREYLADFGLGAKPGSGLPGETSGSLPAPDMADYTRDQISFGQGLSVSAVQMTAAVASVVNGGIYHQPTIIKSATAADGSSLPLPEPESHRVVSEEASAMTVNMMEAVISQMGKDRPIPGYRTAGKSGTAQRFDPKCKCYNGYTASFVGVAPAEDPQLVVYVVLDQPSNGNLGSRLALPVVNNILQMALPRYNVLPSSTPALVEPLTYE